MSHEDFKMFVSNLIKEELDSYQNGERVFNVGSQFNEYVLESALENLTDEKIEKAYNELFVSHYGYENRFTAIGIAWCFSTFEIPELDNAWID